MPRTSASPATSDDGTAPAPPKAPSPRKKPRTSKSAANREHVVVALGELLEAYGDVSRMLDGWKSCGPEGATKEEERRQRQADKTRDKASKVWEAARHA